MTKQVEREIISSGIAKGFSADYILGMLEAAENPSASLNADWRRLLGRMGVNADTWRRGYEKWKEITEYAERIYDEIRLQ